MGAYELNDIREFRDERDRADNDLDHAVARARAKGDSWEKIAQALGVTRQSAWERYGPKVEE